MCCSQAVVSKGSSQVSFFGHTGMACHLGKKVSGSGCSGLGNTGVHLPPKHNSSHILSLVVCMVFVCVVFGYLHCHWLLFLLKLAPVGTCGAWEKQSQNLPLQKGALCKRETFV